MNLQLSFSPKLATLSFDLELASRLNLLDATMYSMSSWHSSLISFSREALSSGSLINDSTAKTCSLQTSWMMVLASSTWVSGSDMSLLRSAILRSFLKTSRSLSRSCALARRPRVSARARWRARCLTHLLVVPLTFLPELLAEQTTTSLFPPLR